MAADRGLHIWQKDALDGAWRVERGRRLIKLLPTTNLTRLKRNQTKHDDMLFVGSAILLLAAASVRAECIASGIDYTDGGQYVIDASSSKNFSFATIFSGLFLFAPFPDRQILTDSCDTRLQRILDKSDTA